MSFRIARWVMLPQRRERLRHPTRSWGRCLRTVIRLFLAQLAFGVLQLFIRKVQPARILKRRRCAGVVKGQPR